MAQRWNVDFYGARRIKRGNRGSFSAYRTGDDWFARLDVRFVAEGVEIDTLTLSASKPGRSTNITTDDLRGLNLGEIKHRIVRLVLDEDHAREREDPDFSRVAELLEPRLIEPVRVDRSPTSPKLGRPAMPDAKLEKVARLFLAIRESAPRGESWVTFMRELSKLEGYEVPDGTARWLLSKCRERQFLIKGPRPGPALRKADR